MAKAQSHWPLFKFAGLSSICQFTPPEAGLILSEAGFS